MARVLSTNPKTVYNREYRKRKQAEKEAAAIAASTEPIDVGMQLDIDENGPTIDVAEPATKSKPSLKERLMGKVAQPPTDKRKRTKKVDDNLLRQLAPTLIATFVATYSRQMLHDPYKPCAPSQEEVLGMVAPYFNVLSRYIEITGQVSQNILDLINALIASITYGVRAYVTYITIKEAEKNHESLEQLHARRTRKYRESLEREQEETNASYADSRQDHRDTGHLANENTVTRNDPIGSENGSSEDIRQDADKVAQLLQRDLAGRRQLGLV